jgi:hypothetical protein
MDGKQFLRGSWEILAAISREAVSHVTIGAKLCRDRKNPLGRFYHPSFRDGLGKWWFISCRPWSISAGGH